MGTTVSCFRGQQSTHHSQIPAEIMYEILLLLPVRTLIRFQCACKSWHSLISSPQFRNDHCCRSQTKPPLLLTLRWNFDHHFTFGFTTYNKVGETLKLVSKFRKQLPYSWFHSCTDAKPFMLSCRGLVCLAFWDLDLCNPPTNFSNSCVGFGYAASTEEFKVVMFFGNYRCQVFTLGTTHWRDVRTPPFKVDYGTAPFLHEAFHFLPLGPVMLRVRDTDYIGAFDVQTEEYREGIPLPPYYYSLGHYYNLRNYEGDNILPVRNFLRLSILGGSLCLTFDFGIRKRYLELWLLKDYYNANWVKGYVIDVYPVYPYPSYHFWAYPADNTIDESIILNCQDETGTKLVKYNPADGIVTLKDKAWPSTFYFETLYTLSR